MSRYSRLGAALIAGMQIATGVAPAYAQPSAAPPDAVYLKDSNVIRGTLTEVIAGDHATVSLPNGQSARITWSFIARIERGGIEQPMGGSVVPMPSPAAAVPAEQGSVMVHIEGDASVALETQVDKKKWVEVCSVPCDRPLPLAPTYRISGSGVRRSRSFHLAGTQGDRVVLVVEPGSTGAFVGGVVALSLGGVALVGGVVTLLVAYAAEAAGLKTGVAEAVGWVLTGSGGVSVVGGILLLSGGKTSVEQSVNTARPRATNDAWQRLPVWAAPAVPVTAPFVSIPLMEHTF